MKWHQISKINLRCQITNHRQQHNCQKAQKHTVFIHGRTNILVANDAHKLRSGCYGCRPGCFRFSLDRQNRPKMARQLLQILQKLQGLTDTSVLTMIFTGFICLLARIRSGDDPFQSYNQPFQLSIFTTGQRFSCPTRAWPQWTKPGVKTHVILGR